MGRALGVVVVIHAHKAFVGFILGRLGGRRFHSSAPWGSLGSFGFVGYIRERPGWSFRRALRFVGFIPFRYGHTGAPLGSSGLCVFAWFIRACPGYDSDSFWRALDVIGLIQGLPLGFVVFIRARPVCHSGVLPWSRRGHSGSLGSFRRALGVVDFIPVRWFHSCVSRGWSGNLGSLGSFGSAVGFRLVRSGAPWWS